jgi:hypothetical protein
MTRENADRLIEFFRTNLVAVKFGNDEPGVYRMKLEAAGTNAYKLLAGDEFAAYWCPYKEDRVFAVTLHDEADRMFTPTMNGCSFGVGIPSIDGAVRVAHANSEGVKPIEKFDLETSTKLTGKKPNSLEFNAILNARGFERGTLKQKLQLEQLKSILAESDDELSNHISRAAYNGCTSITTFGVRVGGAWEFWFQGNINGAVCGCFPFPKVNPK